MCVWFSCSCGWIWGIHDSFGARRREKESGEGLQDTRSGQEGQRARLCVSVRINAPNNTHRVSEGFSDSPACSSYLQRFGCDRGSGEYFTKGLKPCVCVCVRVCLQCAWRCGVSSVYFGTSGNKLVPEGKCSAPREGTCLRTQLGGYAKCCKQRCVASACGRCHSVIQQTETESNLITQVWFLDQWTLIKSVAA